MARGPGTAPLKQSQGEELGGLTQERWEIGLSMLKKKKKGWRWRDVSSHI